jgi:hypothetical protein
VGKNTTTRFAVATFSNLAFYRCGDDFSEFCACSPANGGFKFSAILHQWKAFEASRQNFDGLKGECVEGFKVSWLP